MESDGRTIFENSVVYRVLHTMWRWGSNSRMSQLLNDNRVLLAGVVVIVLFSILRILFSGLHVAIKFASFAVFAVVLFALVWPYTEPLSNP